MSRGSICTRLFGFAVLLAALFALPQVAQAHAGHAHSTHVHTQTDARATDVSTPAAPAIEQQTEQSPAVAASGAPGKRSTAPCSDRGCCGQSTCAMCLSLDAPMPPLLMPPSHGAEIGLTANPLPAGIAGPSLQRPPRSFA
jgi:hypothetical protein